ncbi:MAG: hypothetical protein ACT4OK_12565 [Gemmobacter sp.]
MAGRLAISIYTDRPTTDWAMGRAILGAFCDPDPRLAPQTLSVWSTQHGDFTGIDACEPLWAISTESRVDGRKWITTFGLGWRRAQAPQYRAAITNHTATSANGAPLQGRLALDGPYHKGSDWLALFIRLCAAMGASEGLLTTHLKGGQVVSAPLAGPSRDYAGVGSVIALPLSRVTANHLRCMVEAGFGMAELETCIVVGLMNGLAEARADVPALEARQAELAAILNDGTWTRPKRASWWDGR